ncbi:hypothetical protein KSP40_PGU017461 [Platanthera guangdongensis]|uniref:BP28 C-terminal domain-containing protein n=1 Tax=Platanthera guangdongensis TaxID=2320717 RepID=A0ABR2LVP9_9ASPA
MSIASQLQVIKSLSKGKEDPIHRPLTRPSVLFGPKEAADIDLRSIFPLAQSGLDALIEADDRFSTYKTTLFNHATLDINREKMPPKEEEKLNKSICSYLQLLAGHLHLPASLRTLEYLIRRYQIHIFNVEELVLCALPYHDTQAFVRIVQLLDFGNKKWAFLESVKTSGAPPPRKIIVNQCVHDKGVLEALCNYASPMKGFQHSRPVICFCTAVTVDVLGSIPKLDTDMLQRILTFVFNGLNPTISGIPDHGAGALMIVGLVATRTALASKLVQNMILLIARFARHEASKSSDLQRLRLAVVALVTLVQSQSTQTISKNAMMILKDVRDFVGVLSGLSQEFNIRKFLHVYIESLIDYSSSDDSYYHLLVNVLEALPVVDFVEKIVHKILAQCMKFLNANNLRSHPAGSQVKQILAVIDRQYPSELQGAVHKFLRNSKMKLGEDDSAFLVFCRMLDGNPDMPMEMSDSKIWFCLEHPKASVRRATLLEISSSDSLKSSSGHQQKLVNDALLRRLQDDDLTVVHAALSINGLSEICSPSSLLNAFHDVFLRCINMIRTSTKMVSQVDDVAALCLGRMVLDIPLHHSDFVKEVADIIFPALLVLPQGLEHGKMTELNLRTIRVLAETFIENPLDHMEWLVGCSKQNQLAKCLFFFILLQALVSCKDFAKLSRLFEACFAALKDEWYEMLFVDNGVLAAKFLKEEWCEVESQCTAIVAGELNMERFDKAYMRLANQLLHSDADMLSKKILVSVNWCLLEKIITVARANKLLKDQQLLLLDQLFLFFASSSSINIFKKQLPVVVRNCCEAPFNFLSKYFVEEAFSTSVYHDPLLPLANDSLPIADSRIPSAHRSVASSRQRCFSPICRCFPSLLFLANPVAGWFLTLLLPIADSRIPGASPVAALVLSRSDVDIDNFRRRVSSEVQVESLFSFVSICSMHSSDRSSTNENTLLALLMLPSLLVPLASANKEIRTAAVNCVEGIYKLWQSYDVSRLKKGDDAMFVQCVSTPNFGNFLESMLNQKRLILSDSGKEENGESLQTSSFSSPDATDQPLPLLPRHFATRRCLSLSRRPPTTHLRSTTDGIERLHHWLASVSLSILQLRTATTFVPDSRESLGPPSGFPVAKQPPGGSSFPFDHTGDVHHRFAQPYKDAILLFILTSALKLPSYGKQKVLSFLKAMGSALLQVDGCKELLLGLFEKRNEFYTESGKLGERLSDTEIETLCLLLELSSSINDVCLSCLLKTLKVDSLLLDEPSVTKPCITVLKNLTSAFYITLDSSIQDEIFMNMILLSRSDNGDIKFAAREAVLNLKVLVDFFFCVLRRSVAAPDQNHDPLQRSVRINPQGPPSSDKIYGLLFLFLSLLPCHIYDFGAYSVALDGELASDPAILSDPSPLSTIPADTLHAPDNSIRCPFCLGRFQISCPTIVRSIEEILSRGLHIDSKRIKRKKSTTLQSFNNSEDLFESGGKIIFLLGSLLDILLLKKDIANRETLVQPLFEVLDKLFSNDWLGLSTSGSVSEFSESFSASIYHTQHSTLLILKEIIDSLIIENPDEVNLCKKLNINLLVKCTLSAKDITTRNHIFSLLTSVAKISSEWLSEHIDDLFVIVGESAIKQSDNHSQHILENLVSVLVPCWLAKTNSVGELFEIFIKGLPAISEHRKMTIMVYLLRKSKESTHELEGFKVPLLLSTLSALETVITNLGGFLNPYLDDILDIVILHPEYVLDVETKIKTRASAVRKLLTQKVPVRLVLPALLTLKKTALRCGDYSFSVVFEMLQNLIGVMDRSSINSFHVNIYENCLDSLDIRRQGTESVKDMNFVEQSILQAMVVLTMKLTETMFKPLFFQSLEWAESEIDDQSTKCISIDRYISFYGLVNKLIQQHR